MVSASRNTKSRSSALPAYFTMQKQCGKCLEIKSIEEFYVSISSKDGKQSICKQCSRESSLAYKAIHRKPRVILSEEERRSRKIRSDKNWRKNNPGRVNARRRNYENSKTKAMPSWLSNDQKDEIKRIYELVPIGHHVDHIVPLKGNNVCGLHVPWNLRYLPALMNLKKGNKF